MKNLNFNEALMSFSINGDENRVISFNPGDPNLMSRAVKTQKRLSEKQDEMKEIQLNRDGTPADETEEVVIALEEFESLVREEINYIFNSDVYDIVFNGQSPLCIVGNEKNFLFEEFINSTLPFIEKEMKSFNSASKNRINKYTKEYNK